MIRQLLPVIVIISSLLKVRIKSHFCTGIQDIREVSVPLLAYVFHYMCILCHGMASHGLATLRGNKRLRTTRSASSQGRTSQY
jgi:hypothetical protein